MLCNSFENSKFRHEKYIFNHLVKKNLASEYF